MHHGIISLVHPEMGPNASWEGHMGLANALWEGHMGPPPPELDRQTNRQTRLKTLPSRTLRMRAVINVK